MESEIKLKTCPFCGAVARLQKWYTGYVVECKFCGVSSVAGDTQERAASIWNDRAGEPSSNTAARDALRRIDTLLVSMNCDSAQKRVVDTCRMIVKRALSAPPRNCDEGTVDEQSERFENFCLKYIGCAEETGGRHCVGCPLEKASRHITQKCELYWAQMPYEGGGEK